MSDEVERNKYERKRAFENVVSYAHSLDRIEHPEGQLTEPVYMYGDMWFEVAAMAFGSEADLRPPELRSKKLIEPFKNQAKYKLMEQQAIWADDRSGEGANEYAEEGADADHQRRLSECIDALRKIFAKSVAKVEETELLRKTQAMMERARPLREYCDQLMAKFGTKGTLAFQYKTKLSSTGSAYTEWDVCSDVLSRVLTDWTTKTKKVKVGDVEYLLAIKPKRLVGGSKIAEGYMVTETNKATGAVKNHEVAASIKCGYCGHYRLFVAYDRSDEPPEDDE